MYVCIYIYIYIFIYSITLHRILRRQTQRASNAYIIYIYIYIYNIYIYIYIISCIQRQIYHALQNHHIYHNTHTHTHTHKHISVFVNARAPILLQVHQKIFLVSGDVNQVSVIYSSVLSIVHQSHVILVDCLIYCVVYCLFVRCADMNLLSIRKFLAKTSDDLTLHYRWKVVG
jgi:hypothetical protein